MFGQFLFIQFKQPERQPLVHFRELLGALFNTRKLNNKEKQWGEAVL